MSYTAAIDMTVIQQWVAAKKEISAIEQELQSSGLDAESIHNYIREYKKLRYGKRQFFGFVCTGLGAFLGFISCLLTITNPIPEFYYHILYGFTSVALVVIGVGLYYIFE